MRNITNRIATNGFCALGAGTAAYWPVYEDRSESTPLYRRVQGLSSIEQSQSRGRFYTRRLVVDKQSSPVFTAALQLLVPCEA